MTSGPAAVAPPAAGNAAADTVSVIVPCRNERAHVLAFCDAVTAQRLPAGLRLEVLVADGSSDDGTRTLLAVRCDSDPRFVFVDNPERTVSAGLNRCIAMARGAVLVRMDVHTVYAPDYIAECLAALQRSGADNVGGPWHAVGHTPMQRAIAAAFQSRWVAGGARSRDLAYEGPVDTVYLGCWPRATFERHGGFDETLARNQDDEHNLRLRLAGATVWQSPRIRSSYAPRERLAQLYAQQRQYGYWKPFVMHKHGRPASLRQLAPGAWVGTVIVLLLLAAARPGAPGPLVGLAVVLASYAAFVALASVQAAAADGWALWWRLPAVIATWHVGYGLGTLRGWFDVLRGGRPSARQGVLTR